MDSTLFHSEDDESNKSASGDAGSNNIKEGSMQNKEKLIRGRKIHTEVR